MLQDIVIGENVKIKVIPRSRKTEFIWIMDDGSIKIKLKAIPEDGKANKELISFLRKNFGWNWEVISGLTNTRKIVKKIL